MKLTRHNGRSGKNGTYNPKHNDRRFDLENSEHIDAERAKKNVYWDCYRGFTFSEDREKDEIRDFTFEDVEQIYYNEHYGDFIESQNERNEKNRHSERNRTVDDLLKNKKTCPEETIYQIGNIDETIPPDELFIIVRSFFEELEKRYGEHFHILDWALHVDEGTPHIHERHVFDCKNKYGELCPQQEKALEEMGISLPNPDKPKSKTNNRKKTFDAMCRELLLEICDNRKLYLDREPTYGGRDYLEKQDYILMKQKKQMALQEENIIQQEQTLEELTLKIEDVEMLIDEVSDVAYDKAVEIVTEKVIEKTQEEDLISIEDYKKWVTSTDRNLSKDKKEFIGKCLDVVQNRLIKNAKKILNTVKVSVMHPRVKAESKEVIKKKARSSILEKLNRHKEAVLKGKTDTDRGMIEERKEQGR